MSTEKQNGKVKKMSEKEEWEAYLKYVEASGRKKFPIIMKVKLMPKLYGYGAAIVLVGAFFKLVHLPFIPGVVANIMLGIGLGVEAVIFAVSAHEKPHMEPDWSRIYPEFNEDYCKLPAQGAPRTVISNASNGSAMGQFDSVLSSAGLSGDALEKLSAGINKLGENAGKMADISDAVAATKMYADRMNKAAESVSKLEIQLQSSANIVEANNKLNKTMSEYIDKVNASASSTEALNKQIGDLSKRMAALNNVYGNMLSAMNVKS